MGLVKAYPTVVGGIGHHPQLRSVPFPARKNPFVMLTDKHRIKLIHQMQSLDFQHQIPQCTILSLTGPNLCFTYRTPRALY